MLNSNLPAAHYMTQAIKQIKCPNCAKITQWNSTNSFRPFCSERCQLMDLADWLCEKNTIPGEAAD